MASADVLPATHAPLKSSHHTQQPRPRHQSLPFDPETLSRKLEAHRCALLTDKRRPTTTQVHGYIPRNAAQQFAATTNPIHERPIKHSKSAKVKRSTSNPYQTSSQLHTAPTGGLNPKQLQAGRTMGLSDNEIASRTMAAASGQLDRRESTGSIPNKSNRAQHQKSKRDRKTSAPTQEPTKRDSTDGEHSNHSQPRGYKPGDAARRNSVKRQSMLLGGAVAAGNPHKPIGGGLFDNFSFDQEDAGPDFRLQRFMTDDTPYDPVTLPNVDEEPALTRPKLAAHDRHNWAQQSQYGDDMRDVLGMPKKEKKNSAGAVENLGGVPANIDINARRNARQKSLGDSPPGSLVSDAVKLIKIEEKKKRRQSVIGFFKRF